MTEDWRWVTPHLAVNWHARLIERFGGATAVRDMGLLENVLARPADLVAYGDDASVEKYAALYGFGIIHAHAFVDGNKRLAFAVMVSFLRAHGRALDVTEKDASAVMWRIANGDLTQEDLEQWLVANCHDCRPSEEFEISAAA
jgi:death-on-curing protein